MRRIASIEIVISFIPPILDTYGEWNGDEDGQLALYPTVWNSAVLTKPNESLIPVRKESSPMKKNVLVSSTS